jgi:hypothetical protein
MISYRKRSPMIERIDTMKDETILRNAIEAGALVALILFVLLLGGCDVARPIEGGPPDYCPALYCLADGSEIVWDPCQPHPAYSQMDPPVACTTCHIVRATRPHPCP